MPYIRVHVDLEDVLDDISTEDLQEELASRCAPVESRNNFIPTGEAMQALMDAADVLRRSGQVSLAYKLDEVRADYIEPRHDPIRRRGRFSNAAVVRVN